jgi:hypothetical protein
MANQTTPAIQIKDSNVGIGTVSPTTKLHVGAASVNQSSISTSNSTNLGLFLQAVGNDNVTGNIQSGITFGEGNSGLYSYDAGGSGAQGLSIFTGSFSSLSERMRITNDGNVGIGTTSPGAPLHIFTSDISNSLQISGYPSSGNPLTFLESNYGALNAVKLKFLNYNPSNGYDSDFGIQLMNTSQVMNDVFIIKGSTGNVGIGTASPGQKLHIAESNTTSYVASSVSLIQPDGGANILIQNTGGGGFSSLRFVSLNGSNAIGYIGFNNSTASVGGDFVIGQRNGGNSYTEQVRITAAGNVGIGTTNPGFKLDVSGTTRSTTFKSDSATNSTGIEISAGTTSGTGAILRLTKDASNKQVYQTFENDTLYLGVAANQTTLADIGTKSGVSLVISTGYTERMRIDSAGNVGIGTTNPYEILDINGNIRLGNYTTAGTRYIGYANNTFANQFIAGMSIESTTVGGNYSQRLNFATHNYGVDAAVRMTITENGRLGIGTTAPSTILELALPNSSHSNQGITFTSTGGYGGGAIYNDYGQGNGLTAFKIWNTYCGSQINLALDSYSSSGSPSSIRFYTSTLGTANAVTERMRIDSVGNVGIGTTAPAAKLEVYGTGFTSGSVNFLARNGVGTKIIESFDDGLIRLNNTLNINQAIYINNGNSNVHYALDSHIFNVVNDSFQRTDFVTIKGNAGKPAMGVGTMSPDNSAILDLTSRSKGFLPPRMTNTEMNAISSPAAGLVVYDTTNNKLTVYAGSSWVPLH